MADEVEGDPVSRQVPREPVAPGPVTCRTLGHRVADDQDLDRISRFRRRSGRHSDRRRREAGQHQPGHAPQRRTTSHWQIVAPGCPTLPEMPRRFLPTTRRAGRCHAPICSPRCARCPDPGADGVLGRGARRQRRRRRRLLQQQSGHRGQRVVQRVQQPRPQRDPRRDPQHASRARGARPLPDGPRADLAEARAGEKTFARGARAHLRHHQRHPHLGLEGPVRMCRHLQRQRRHRDDLGLLPREVHCRRPGEASSMRPVARTSRTSSASRQ